MNTISISEIQRNLHKLDGFDIVEVIDKKRQQTKGYFLDKKYQSIVENLFKEQEDKKNEKLEAFKKASQNVTKLQNSNINLIKLDEEINSDIF